MTSVCLAAGVSPLPQVDTMIDPGRSFWSNHVHYGVPHQVAKVRDGRGRLWQLAYLDLYQGPDEKRRSAPVLVMLHGRAMNSGYWGNLLQRPLDAGWRVISIDWSHTGKSLPLNLDLPVNRSLDDARHLVHELVVEQLGIARASYLGHSLGGQLAAGYAIRHPEHVERLVLYAPGGLESMPPVTRQGIRIDDPALAEGADDFLVEWEKSGILPSMGRTAEAVERGFYEPLRPGSRPYVRRGDPLGEFMVASRASILRGDPREKQRALLSYGWDSLSALMECRVEDADSFPGRLTRLKVPTLLALGVQDPLYPLPGSGNTSLVGDTVQTVWMLAGGPRSPLQIRLYPGAGHFLHTDLPELFGGEVMAFLAEGKWPEKLYEGDPAPWLPPPRAALRDLPEDVAAFKRSYEQAFLRHDLDAVRQVIHPDYRKNGESREQRLQTYQSFLAAVTRWELKVYSIERKGDAIEMEAETVTNFGVFPDRFTLRVSEGVWRSYGNQL